MNEYMEIALKGWKETRMETIAFVKGLSEDMLMAQLPRPGLNYFGYHVQELGVIQRAYTHALQNSSMDYSLTSFQRDDNLIYNAEKIIEFINKEDVKFQKAVAEVQDPKCIIDWQLQRNPTALEHVFWLTQHETLHHGQFLAFCYIMNISIPEALSQHWNMPPVDQHVIDKWISLHGHH